MLKNFLMLMNLENVVLVALSLYFVCQAFIFFLFFLISSGALSKFSFLSFLASSCMFILIYLLIFQTLFTIFFSLFEFASSVFIYIYLFVFFFLRYIFPPTSTIGMNLFVLFVFLSLWTFFLSFLFYFFHE